ncbi:MAG: alkyl hydroperoxide reductase subunit F [Bdellovibrionales bacterium CG12_big_fil_rev_8_21_14_0_65_38_15]|nr:MAG: alkyl hydroperoxide reductase subunit F [Bdellovibrionales bacterium CG22_combo_CG10-13_8_21_14_all_38_13]PIQ57013.1 MAG: alkyl hydroperoxide reductase subunit F [Bdellovibrionales bacterium CG12_big_fil_rev_8_21_14_0_65_38_15]PIR29026.1 MAG: alkyl hydroperoxide reductase subunit F [Bdellovibrionales bacterium CG11_big_fil_rev_8_21_14_0_20_38_13]
MLDQNIIEQLKSVFEKLETKVILKLNKSSHANQAELEKMLEQVSSTSSLIELVNSDIETVVPEFSIQDKNVKFRGIPSGHEFTSLILAILNSDGKGKFPDEMILNRIKALKGPINLKTYISLSCENCPDVVQALNMMAILHSDFTHTMIDGAYEQDEIARLGIQGVPSVVSNDKLISAGKISLVDLLAKLEAEFGINESEASSVNKDLGEFDVVVIGGGPAGASAAIYTARKGMKTAILAEKIGGQVKDTKGIENLISVPYTEGPALSAQLAKHIAEYPIKLLEHRRVKTISKDGVKHIELESGEFLKAKSIVITTGANWRKLGVEGENEYVGRGVAYCPHCDGPYYKGKKVAVVGGGNSGVEAAIDLAGLVRELIVFEFMDTLKADKVLVDKLKSLPNVSIVTNARTSQVIGDGAKVTAIEYVDRKTEETVKVDLDGIFVQIGLLPNSGFVKDIVETTKFGEIVIDNKGRTNVKGIYAAGDVTTVPYKQIIIAMGEGAKAGLAAFEDQMLN